MIDPFSITNYSRTTCELEEFALFCCCVQGKQAGVQAAKLDEFLNINRERPFEYVRNLVEAGRLSARLREVRLGMYARLTLSFEQLAFSNIDLASCSLADLLRIDGFGPKSARFFLLHSRESVRCAVLDRHILGWMRSLGYEVPVTTPSAPAAYAKIEQWYLRECDLRGRHPAQLDLEVWSGKARKFPASL